MEGIIVDKNITYGDIAAYVHDLKAETDALDADMLVYETEPFISEYKGYVGNKLKQIHEKYDKGDDLDNSDIDHMKSLYFMHYLNFFYYEEEPWDLELDKAFEKSLNNLKKALGYDKDDE